jgi:cytochrome c oxidase assembly protein subunit 15
MFTVTLLLKPLIVTLHLLFGLATVSMLWWLWLAQRRRDAATGAAPHARSGGVALLAVVVLGLQIALGGWTSSNYAAVACPDFPQCQASWWPEADFRDAFVLWRGLGINYEGGVLNHPARVAIHFTHRLGALVATLVVLAAAIGVLLSAAARPRARRAALVVLAALALQLGIGIGMVEKGFPLWLATAHNAGAALLLLSTLGFVAALRRA